MKMGAEIEKKAERKIKTVIQVEREVGDGGSRRWVTGGREAGADLGVLRLQEVGIWRWCEW